MKDTDCPQSTRQYCTRDGLCVADTPRERICDQIYPSDPPSDAIPVGVTLHLKYSRNPEKLRLNALKLGIDKINEWAKADGRPLVLHICDLANTPKPGEQFSDDPQISRDNERSVSVLLNEHKVVALVGPGTSTQVYSIARLVGPTGHSVPIVSPSATAVALSQLPQRDYIFRLMPSDELLAATYARIIPTNVRNWVLLHSQEFHGEGLANSFLGAWKGPELQPGHMYSWPALEKADFSGILQINPDLVVVFSNSGTLDLIKRLKNIQIKAPIFFSPNARSDTVLSQLRKRELEPEPQPDHFARIRGIGPWLGGGSDFELFRGAFQYRFNEDPSTNFATAYAWDALFVVAIAVGSVEGEVTGSAVTDALRRIRIAPPLTTPPQPRFRMWDFLNAIKGLKMSSITLIGATGAIGFDINGERQGGLFEEWSINPAGGADMKGSFETKAIP